MYKIYHKLWYTQFCYTKHFLRVMKLLIILMTTCLMQVSASTFAQKINLSERGVTLISIFEKINKQSGVEFLASEELLSLAKPVSIHVTNEDLDEVLEVIFKNQPLSYTIKDRAVVVTKKERSFVDQIKT